MMNFFTQTGKFKNLDLPDIKTIWEKMIKYLTTSKLFNHCFIILVDAGE